MRIQSNNEWLSTFRKINALNDCFHIWHRGQFSTINGFRLGSDVPPIPIPEGLQWKSNLNRMSSIPNFSVGSHGSSIDLSGNVDNTIYSGIGAHTGVGIDNVSRENSQGKSQTIKKDNQAQLGTNHVNKGTITIPNNPNSSGQNSNISNYNHFKVSWSEINAALGTAALLLSILDENKNNQITFRCHKIIPMGSFSKIVLLLPIQPNTNKSPVTYNLYTDDSFSLFGKRNFNTALNALLNV